MAKSAAAKPAAVKVAPAKSTAVKSAAAKAAPVAKPTPAKKAAKPAAAKSAKKALQRSPHHTRLFELGHHLTHAVALELALKKTIKSSDIYKRLLAILHQTFIDYKAPVSDYIHSDNMVEALRSFAITLNKSAQFDGDGLNLAPGDLTDAEKMGDIGTAIVAWYSENGWTVLPE